MVRERGGFFCLCCLFSLLSVSLPLLFSLSFDLSDLGEQGGRGGRGGGRHGGKGGRVCVAVLSPPPLSKKALSGRGEVGRESSFSHT